jgi:hypothetical protein
MPLWLSESDVRAALPLTEMIDAMEAALIAFSAGRVVQPVRTVFGIRERCFFGLVPAMANARARGAVGAEAAVREPAGAPLPGPSGSNREVSGELTLKRRACLSICFGTRTVAA